MMLYIIPALLALTGLYLVLLGIHNAIVAHRIHKRKSPYTRRQIITGCVLLVIGYLVYRL